MCSPCSLSYLSKWHHCTPRNSSPNLGLIPVSTWPPSPNPIRQQMLEILNKFFWNKSWISPLLLLWSSPKPPSIIIPLDSHKSLLTLLLLLLYTPFSSQKIESPLRNKNQSISLPCLIQLYSWPVLPPMSHPFVSPQPNCLFLLPHEPVHQAPLHSLPLDDCPLCLCTFPGPFHSCLLIAQVSGQLSPPQKSLFISPLPIQ